MKVLYLLNHAGKAGTERYVESLVTYLSRDGKVDPYFVYNEGGLLVERMKALHVPTRQLAMKSRFDFDAAKALACICKDWDIDIVHCHYLRENYIALLAKKYFPKLRVVYTSHFILANDFVTRLSNKWLDRRQDSIIAVCNRGKEQLVQNGWTADKIQVIFNAVDPLVWRGGDSSLRQEFGISPQSTVMLCASRFADDKGHSYLVESLKKLAALTKEPFTMVLAGDGPLLEETKQQVKSLGLAGHVIFTGFRSDIKNLYKGSDIYVNSSRHEALSYLIIEAMAAGLPVIVTDMAGNRDIVPPDAKCGLLVEYNNPDSMANGMKKLIEDQAFRASCAAAAVAEVDEKFEINKWSAATYGVYEKAVEA